VTTTGRNRINRKSNPAGSLRPKQCRFVEEYVVDFNGAQAAIRAGCSQKTARQIGQKLLTKVDIIEAIQKRMERLTTQCELKTELVLRQLARICFLDPRKLFDRKGKLLNLAQLDDDTAAAVASVETTGSTTKVRFWSKIEALNLAGRYLKLFKEDMPSQAQMDRYVVIVPATASPENWQKIVEQHNQKPNGPFGTS